MAKRDFLSNKNIFNMWVQYIFEPIKTEKASGPQSDAPGGVAGTPRRRRVPRAGMASAVVSLARGVTVRRSSWAKLALHV